MRNISRLSLVYYSSTLSTKKIVQYIASEIGLRVPTVHCDITKIPERIKEHVFNEDDLLIIGVPSYWGRMPSVEPGLFSNFKGSNTPAVIICVYGNRDFGDTLLEMRDILVDRGFICVSAAVVVAEHAFSKNIATDRPDELDKIKMKEFARKTALRLNAEDDIVYLNVPGSYPYRPIPEQEGFSPVTQENCILCMQCFRWCPVDAIPYYDPMSTDAAKCIRCMGCVKRCPVYARIVENENHYKFVREVEDKFSNKRLETKYFL